MELSTFMRVASGWYANQPANQLPSLSQILCAYCSLRSIACLTREQVQPFSVNGTEPALRPQWYGSQDLHDANRMNNHRNLPVLLDFDNYSGDEDQPDDIRRLSAWPNATRAAFVRTLWHTLRLYSPHASLSLPLSKVSHLPIIEV